MTIKSPILIDSRASWIRLILSMAAGVTVNIGMWAVILVLPKIQADFGIDRADS